MVKSDKNKRITKIVIPLAFKVTVIFFSIVLLIQQLTLVYRAASNMENASKGSVCVIIIITSTDMNVHVSPPVYLCLSRLQESEI